MLETTGFAMLLVAGKERPLPPLIKYLFSDGTHPFPLLIDVYAIGRLI